MVWADVTHVTTKMIRVGHATISVCCELPYVSTGQSTRRRHANSAQPGWSDTLRIFRNCSYHNPISSTPSCEDEPLASGQDVAHLCTRENEL